MALDEGFGTTITWQSGFLATIRSASFGGIVRNALVTSHMATTNGWHTKQPSDLKDMGTLTVEILFNPSSNWKTAITAAAETITVTFPVHAGGSTGGSVACSGFATNFQITDPYDDLMTATVELTFSGEPTFTAPT